MAVERDQLDGLVDRSATLSSGAVRRAAHIGPAVPVVAPAAPLALATEDPRALPSSYLSQLSTRASQYWSPLYVR